MNEEAQRIAIAEACEWNGWIAKKAESVNDGLWLLINPDGDKVLQGSQSSCERARDRHQPDFLNDLNAMHEAEKTLRIGVDLHIGQRWFGYLANVVSGKQMYLNEYDWPGAAYFICRATAKQRAEAFLRTIGKWEDGK